MACLTTRRQWQDRCEIKRPLVEAGRATTALRSRRASRSNLGKIVRQRRLALEFLLQAYDLEPRFGDHAGQKRILVLEGFNPANMTIQVLAFAKIIHRRARPRPVGFHTYRTEQITRTHSSPQKARPQIVMPSAPQLGHNWRVSVLLSLFLIVAVTALKQSLRFSSVDQSLYVVSDLIRLLQPGASFFIMQAARGSPHSSRHTELSTD